MIPTSLKTENEKFIDENTRRDLKRSVFYLEMWLRNWDQYARQQHVGVIWVYLYMHLLEEVPCAVIIELNKGQVVVAHPLQRPLDSI